MSTVTQCRLMSEDKQTIVSWIPTKSAVLGKFVTVEDYGDKRFMVSNIYDTMDEAYIKERSRDYRNTRKASDV